MPRGIRDTFPTMRPPASLICCVQLWEPLAAELVSLTPERIAVNPVCACTRTPLESLAPASQEDAGVALPPANAVSDVPTRKGARPYDVDRSAPTRVLE